MASELTKSIIRQMERIPEHPENYQLVYGIYANLLGDEQMKLTELERVDLGETLQLSGEIIGTIKTYEIVNTKERCSHCGGTGRERNSTRCFTCAWCDGTGYTEKTYRPYAEVEFDGDQLYEHLNLEERARTYIKDIVNRQVITKDGVFFTPTTIVKNFVVFGKIEKKEEEES